MAGHTDAQFIALARELHQKYGEVEFDYDARVSREKGEVNGAYVQAWVWVEFPDLPVLDEQCPSLESPLSARSCQCDHAIGHDGSHICAQHALHWTPQ